MKVTKVKQIEEAFNSVKIPAEFQQHYKAEIMTLKRQEERNGGFLVNNNQVYASLGNLRKLLKLCTKK